MREKEPNINNNSCGVALVDLETVRQEIVSKETSERAFTHLILQSRQFVSGERSSEFYKGLVEHQSGIVVINVDSSARRDYEKGFANIQMNGIQESVRFTHEKYSKIPLIGPYIGRNHVRMILIGETAYLSSFDFAEPSFDRNELFLKVTQPELVQMLKIIALWDFDSPKENLQQSAGGFDLVFDTGKSSKGYVSRYAESQIKQRLNSNFTMWIVSSWCPDELEGFVNEASKKGCQVNLLVNRQYEYESLKKIPFNVTKIISNHHFINKTNKADYLIYNPRQKQIHAKFILLENGEQYWWLVGTSNHTRFGPAALTTEIGIAGIDRGIGKGLSRYISDIDKFIVV